MLDFSSSRRLISQRNRRGYEAWRKYEDCYEFIDTKTTCLLDICLVYGGASVLFAKLLNDMRLQPINSIWRKMGRESSQICGDVLSEGWGVEIVPPFLPCRPFLVCFGFLSFGIRWSIELKECLFFVRIEDCLRAAKEEIIAR